jgi:hypothetical protein
LHEYFTNDHQELDELFKQAVIGTGEFDLEKYGKFRGGLLKHIKMEETILFPLLNKLKQESLSPLLAQLRLDHGALTTLMVPPPSNAVIKAVSFILSKHNILEEEIDGMYDACDALNEDTILEIEGKIEKTTEVPLLPFNSEPYVYGAVQRALERAGYNWDEFKKS